MALDGKEILKKMTSVYHSLETYELYSKYDLFKGSKSSTVEESYQGYICKNGDKVYQKIDHTEFIITPTFCLKISNDEKIVELSRGQAYINQEIDFQKTIKECKELTVEEKDKMYYITLIIKNSSQVPFSTVKVKVNKSNYRIAQLDLFYTDMQDFSKDPKKKDLNQPHLRILYSDFSKKIEKVSNTVFNYETYFKTVNTMIVPIGLIKDYELIDNRI